MFRYALLLLAIVVSIGIFGCGNSKVISNGIVLAGHGQIKSMPDVAEISLSIVTRDRTNNRVKATTANATKSTAVRVALIKSGLTSREISTESYTAESVQPYDYYPNYRPKGRPYFQVTNVMLVRTKSSKDIGKLVDAALSAGATSIDSVNYSFENPAQQQAKALALAVKDAKLRAQAVAEAGGVKLLPISHVRQTTSYGYPVRILACKMRAKEENTANTYVAPRKETITADVVVTFAVERR